VSDVLFLAADPAKGCNGYVCRVSDTATGYECVDNKTLCDGVRDCLDGKDEKNCEQFRNEILL